MTTKLSMGVDPITGDIKIGRAKEIRPGLYMFTGQTGMIYGKKFRLTYTEEPDQGANE